MLVCTGDNACEPSVHVAFEAHAFNAVGDTIRSIVHLGAGHLSSSSMTIARVKLDLDCENGSLGLNCQDDGPVVSYQGNLETSCPVEFTTTSVPGDLLPNQVTFTATDDLTIPADSPDFCSVAFDMRLETRSNDVTPLFIEQVIGIDSGTGDAVCDSVPPHAGGASVLSRLRLCPSCDDGNVCTSDSCAPQDGCRHADTGICTGDVKGRGYWKRLCSGQDGSGEFLSPEDVACVQSECTFQASQSVNDLCGELRPRRHRDRCAQAESRFMGLMLNVCRERLSRSATIVSSCGTMQVSEMIGMIDALLCAPVRDEASCRRALCFLDAAEDN